MSDQDQTGKLLSKMEKLRNDEVFGSENHDRQSLQAQADLIDAEKAIDQETSGNTAEFETSPAQLNRTCRWPERNCLGQLHACGRPALLELSVIEHETGKGLIFSYCQNHVLVAIETLAVKLRAALNDLP